MQSYYVRLRVQLAVWWIVFCSWFRPRPYLPQDLLKTLVVIGDSFAFGVGDWVVMGGLSGPARQFSRLLAESDHLRLPWAVFQKAAPFTTSSDWLPGTAHLNSIINSEIGKSTRLNSSHIPLSRMPSSA
eukprot:TRINITY_DN212_c0_g5_i1.p1 TRINITY_DN212_c0_g5~~TRINITY_DN212_c0_g5_i1.p1  ORF type:complete len:129 (+),score=18.02 TRINITY_DN212_c0_g5_i1:214-600(+)